MKVVEWIVHNLTLADWWHTVLRIENLDYDAIQGLSLIILVFSAALFIISILVYFIVHDEKVIIYHIVGALSYAIIDLCITYIVAILSFSFFGVFGFMILGIIFLLVKAFFTGEDGKFLFKIGSSVHDYFEYLNKYNQQKREWLEKYNQLKNFKI